MARRSTDSSVLNWQSFRVGAGVGIVGTILVFGLAYVAFQRSPTGPLVLTFGSASSASQTETASTTQSPSQQGTASSSGSASQTPSASQSPSQQSTASSSCTPATVSLPVQLGDRELPSSAYDSLLSSLRCWTKEGSWEQGGNDLYPPAVPPDMRNGGLVTPIYSDCGDASRRSDLNYTWSTPSCLPLPQFSPAAMCRAMRGRTLMFVGDSLTIAHFETTLQAMAHGRPSAGCGWNDGPALMSWTTWRTYDFCTEHGAPAFNVTFTCHNNALEGYGSHATAEQSLVRLSALKLEPPSLDLPLFPRRRSGKRTETI